MKATFENSVNVLVKAYMNDTLHRLDCHACAVGNIVADANGYNIRFWYDQFEWMNECDPIEPIWCKVSVESDKQIKPTGYTRDQIRSIENAFMGHGYGEEMSIDNFDSLMRTVDRLAEIHNIDLTTREEYKKLFVKI